MGGGGETPPNIVPRLCGVLTIATCKKTLHIELQCLGSLIGLSRIFLVQMSKQVFIRVTYHKKARTFVISPAKRWDTPFLYTTVMFSHTKEVGVSADDEPWPNA